MSILVKSRVFVCRACTQDSIDVCVYEGERGCTDGNNLLGEFNITGIERAKRGVPKIDVTFELDANGILTVTACDVVTKVVNKIVISNNRCVLDRLGKSCLHTNTRIRVKCRCMVLRRSFRHVRCCGC